MDMSHDPNLGLKVLAPTHVIKVGENVDWSAAVGFGRNAPMVTMMNQMMVAGSGMEGMKMSPMAMDFGPDAFASIGTVVPGSQTQTNGDHPMGNGQNEANGSPGDASSPGSLPVHESVSGTIYDSMFTHSPVKVGANSFEIQLKTKEGQTVENATLVATVKMTEMDMGEAHPAVVNKGHGWYRFVVTFSMSGKWVVSLDINVNGKTQSLSVPYTVP